MLKELELRRSCRNFSNREVEDSKINEIIKAGLNTIAIEFFERNTEKYQNAQ